MNLKDTTYLFVEKFALPIGIFCLMSGIFWIGDLDRLPRLFYFFLVLPTLLLLVIKPQVARVLLHSQIAVVYLLFAAYLLLTLLWSAGIGGIDLLKRLVLVAVLFLATLHTSMQRFDLVEKVVHAASVVAVLGAIIALASHLVASGQGRLVGYGAFRNPLLTSHVFGFFMTLLLGLFFAERSRVALYPLIGLLILGALLVATGSRTPLLAGGAALLWLTFLTHDRRSMLYLCVALLIAAFIVFWKPEIVLQRGVSYRPYIWLEALDQIGQRPWFGHGYGASLSIELPGVARWSDPHNLTLLVLYSSGLVGAAFWTFMYGSALYQSWQNRSDKWVVVFSATVVFGLVAGMTEGGSFIPRPNERWFIIWIPLALLAAVIGRKGENVAA